MAQGATRIGARNAVNNGWEEKRSIVQKAMVLSDSGLCFSRGQVHAGR